MNFKLSFKGANRRVNNKEISTFEELKSLCEETFKTSLGPTTSYAYVDSDDDEVTIVEDSDVQIMCEDMSDTRVIKLRIKQKIDQILRKKPKNQKNGKKPFMVDSKTGKKVKFESSSSISKDPANGRGFMGRRSREIKRKVFQKKLIKQRTKRQKEAAQLEYLREIEKLEKKKLKKLTKIEENAKKKEKCETEKNEKKPDLEVFNLSEFIREDYSQYIGGLVKPKNGLDGMRKKKGKKLGNWVVLAGGDPGEVAKKAAGKNGGERRGRSPTVKEYKVDIQLL